jgi:dTDP-4-dehydrorhamnose 3,5-epimerase-like enzyme
MKPEQSQALPDGVAIMPLTRHPDRRGDMTEFFRNEWVQAPSPVQWLISRTEARHGPSALPMPRGEMPSSRWGSAK